MNHIIMRQMTRRKIQRRSIFLKTKGKSICGTILNEMLSKRKATMCLQKNWSRLDEDTGVLIKSAELVKIPLTFRRHLFRLSFTDSNLLMELAAEPRVTHCSSVVWWWPVARRLGSENSCSVTRSAKRRLWNPPLSSGAIQVAQTLYFPTWHSFSYSDSANWNTLQSALYCC